MGSEGKILVIYAYVIKKLPLKEALRFANACGALSTTGIGGTAAQPTFQEVQAFLRKANSAIS